MMTLHLDSPRRSRMMLANAARQEGELAPVEIGAGPVRERSLDLIGRAAYRASSVTLYGYFSFVTGLDAAEIYTDTTAPGANSARFTYVGDVLGGLGDTGDVRQILGDGTITIYFQENGGSSFDAPVSFTSGQAIATAAMQLRDLLQVLSPDLGVLAGEADLAQAEAEPFTLDGEVYRFGHVGVEQRWQVTGWMETLQPDGATIVNLSGSAAVTIRDPIPSATPSAANNSAAQRSADAGGPGACEGLPGWLEDVEARLVQSVNLRSTIPPDGALESGVLREVAATLSTMSAAERESPPPDVAVAASRLVVTTLSTYGRGVTLLATAVEADDAEMRSRALTVLADGDELRTRAEVAITEASAACPGGAE